VGPIVRARDKKGKKRKFHLVAIRCLLLDLLIVGDSVGKEDEKTVGAVVGPLLGALVGSEEGELVGLFVGEDDGEPVGAGVGPEEGVLVGLGEGTPLGAKVVIGPGVGEADGLVETGGGVIGAAVTGGGAIGAALTRTGLGAAVAMIGLAEGVSVPCIGLSLGGEVGKGVGFSAFPIPLFTLIQKESIEF
jgi:hypothetical protein